jgi:probable HAF family extracellular repeat protein
MRAALHGCLTAALAVLVVADAHGQTPRYVVTDLGDFGGGESIASAINTAGQVVGTSWLPGRTPGARCDENRPFLYQNGVLSPLPTLPGTRFGYASGINDHGEVSGSDYVYVPGSGPTCFPGFVERQTPVLRSGGASIDLSAGDPTPSPWYAGVAFDVSNLSQVVGWSWRTAGGYHGFLWENGSRQDVGTLGGWSIASAINDNGVVVGYSDDGTGSFGFRIDGETMTRYPVVAAANKWNGTNDVSASGDAVGWSGPDGGMAQAVRYPSAGGVEALGTLGGTQSSAYAMNDAGDAVGYSFTASNADRHATLWRSGQVFDLNDTLPAGTDWQLVVASDINAGGKIVGYGCRNGRWSINEGLCRTSAGDPGFRRAFLLTPAVTVIGGLGDLILSFDLPKGMENSLLAKVDAAQALADAGDLEGACAVLRALSNQVQAQSGKALTPAQADLLLQNIALVRQDIGCS